VVTCHTWLLLFLLFQISSTLDRSLVYVCGCLMMYIQDSYCTFLPHTLNNINAAGMIDFWWWAHFAVFGNITYVDFQFECKCMHCQVEELVEYASMSDGCDSSSGAVKWHYVLKNKHCIHQMSIETLVIVPEMEAITQKSKQCPWKMSCQRWVMVL
jgi:hypothetical protein